MEKFENGTAENITRFAQCILDWTHQCMSPLPLVAKAARLQTATTQKCFINWAGYVSCGGSLKTDFWNGPRDVRFRNFGENEFLI